MKLKAKLQNRFYDVLLSVYLYNEKQGYEYLEMLLDYVKKNLPNEGELIESIAKHAKDEKKHYHMFCHYFSSQKKHPFLLNEKIGYCEQLIQTVLGSTLNSFHPSTLKNDQLTEIFKMIMLTEKRGLKQVNELLKMRWIQNNKKVTQIFKVIQKDEPSHFEPYQKWLKMNHKKELSKKEILLERLTHYQLIWIKIPLLFINPYLKKEPIRAA